MSLADPLDTLTFSKAQLCNQHIDCGKSNQNKNKIQKETRATGAVYSTSRNKATIKTVYTDMAGLQDLSHIHNGFSSCKDPIAKKEMLHFKNKIEFELNKGSISHSLCIPGWGVEIGKNGLWKFQVCLEKCVNGEDVEYVVKLYLISRMILFLASLDQHGVRERDSLCNETDALNRTIFQFPSRWDAFAPGREEEIDENYTGKETESKRLKISAPTKFILNELNTDCVWTKLDEVKALSWDGFCSLGVGVKVVYYMSDQNQLFYGEVGELQDDVVDATNIKRLIEDTNESGSIAGTAMSVTEDQMTNGIGGYFVRVKKDRNRNRRKKS